MREIFSLDEYAIDLPFEPAVILDCGANVGFASLYFASRYPSARIYALEPDPGTFRRLEANTLDADNVVAIARALAAQDGAIPFFSSPASVSSSLTRRSSDQREISVDAVSLGSLMGSLGLTAVDVLKLDIEGAEFSVLENAGEALRAVGAVVAEIHYDLGERDERWLRNLLADFDCALTPGRFSGRQLLKALRREPS